MNSDKVKAGVEHAPHRSLLKADGYNDEQMRRPFIGVVNSFNEVAPGHMHLQTIARCRKGRRPCSRWNTDGVQYHRCLRWYRHGP